MSDPRAAAPPAFLSADQSGGGPGCLDFPDNPDRNTSRYAGPRPADGQQNIGQDCEPVPGSPVGPADRPAEGGHGPQRFRKLPVVVEAIRWTAASTDAVTDFLGDRYLGGAGPGKIKIETLEGPAPVCMGDWIVRGTLREVWPCRADIFTATYEPTEEPVTGDDGGPRGCR